MGRETGKDRMSMKAERNTSRGRFKRGSLTMGVAIECDLSADNYLTHKHEKLRTGLKNK